MRCLREEVISVARRELRELGDELEPPIVDSELRFREVVAPEPRHHAGIHDGLLHYALPDVPGKLVHRVGSSSTAHAEREERGKCGRGFLILRYDPKYRKYYLPGWAGSGRKVYPSPARPGLRVTIFCPSPIHGLILTVQTH